MKTPGPLTSALAAALATGVVIAASAVANSSSTAPQRAVRSPFRAAPPPTRAQAIAAAATARTEYETKLSASLGVSMETLRAAERAVLSDQLDASVKAQRLSEPERAAQLACFDDPVGCRRDDLPVSDDPAVPTALQSLPLVTRRTYPAQRVLRRLAPLASPRPVASGPGGAFVNPASALARKLKLPVRRVAESQAQATARVLGPVSGRERLDPDGVPLISTALPLASQLLPVRKAVVPIPARRHP